MTNTGITMRVIPTTVSAGAIGISDTTGINRQNRKNSYIPHNRQSLPTARRVRIATPHASSEVAGSGGWLTGCKRRCRLQNAAYAAATKNESNPEFTGPLRSRDQPVNANGHEDFIDRPSGVWRRPEKAAPHDHSGFQRSDLGDQLPIAHSIID
jgi:hypothetical protein